MALPKIASARDLNDAELAEEIVKAKRELFNLRLQKATRRLEKTHQFKHLRHRIAQLLTIEGERKREAKKAAVATKSPETATVAASTTKNTQEAASEEE